MANKPCLVEKAFMANHAQSVAIVELARQRGLFLAEAIWTRYQPVVSIVRDLISSGRIGTPRLVTATLGYSMGEKPRIMRPDLCGGALLDLGVYALNFVRMFFPADIVNNPQKVTVNTHDREFVEDIHVPQQITGYEYQFIACREALLNGLKEPLEMPHEETLFIMRMMDDLRQRWGVHYPMDDKTW